MNKPALFMKFNSQSRREFLYMKRKYLERLNLKGNCHILDIGCGPGDVTRHALLPCLPTSTKKIVGVDISSDMVEFARKYHMDDERISYNVLDIARNDVPTQFLEHFDYAFSFYCLHSVSNIRKAMSNIHAMLKPKGEILVNLISSCYLFDLYENLSAVDKWKPYIYNYNNLATSFQNSTDSKENFGSILKQAGFKINICEQKRRMIGYSKEEFASLTKAISYVKIPKDLEQEFELIQFKGMQDADNVFNNDYDEVEVYDRYTLLVAHAIKI